ncbi:MAG: CDP-glycerol glycerophosphotransferase family protein, partial [Clostridia bacterium]|nr:CDP-glycerol glycerophosphotransferase family protein [Clostridia bacterium]
MDIKAVFKNITKKILRTGFEIFLKILSCIFKLFPLKERVCFYSIRSDGGLLENAKAVYDKLDCKKTVLANMLPHSHRLIVKIYFYLLTSKVIVTDDYLKYLRYISLRKKQKVVQVWHACGAFKKFGLDAPSKLSREMEK